MISPRYATAFIIIAGIALIPTLIHNYIGMVADDGKTVRKISRSLGGFLSEPTARKEKWVKKTFQSSDWIERYYHQPSKEPLLLFVGRSYDPKRLYHHPELGLVHGSNLEGMGTFRLPERPDMPIHLLRGSLESQNDLVVYALLQNKRFVGNPYLFQLKGAWKLLFRARQPMTLFFVYDSASSHDLVVEKSAAVRLLIEAVEDFQSQMPKG